jgi:4'-phosphopantetheinyl transferase
VEIAAGEVHLWIADLDVSKQARRCLAGTLTSPEFERSRRFRYPLLRARFEVLRALRRLVLARYLEGDPATIDFELGPHAKPEIAGEATGGLRFNESASEGRAVYAVTRAAAIGVDVERFREVPEAERIIEYFATPTEHQMFSALAVADRPRAFIRWWTAKEAFLKATGMGLAGQLDSFSMSFPGREQIRIVGGARANTGRPKWTVLEQPSREDTYALTVVVQGAVVAFQAYRAEYDLRDEPPRVVGHVARRALG